MEVFLNLVHAGYKKCESESVYSLSTVHQFYCGAMLLQALYIPCLIFFPHKQAQTISIYSF